MSLNEILSNQRKPYLNMVGESLKLTGVSNQILFDPNNGVNNVSLSTNVLTAPRVINFPDASGTIALTSGIISPSRAQMNFANGSATIPAAAAGVMINFIQPGATTQLTQNTSDWAMNSLGVLTYSGATSRTFRISYAATASFGIATGGLGAAVWSFGVQYNGGTSTFVPGSWLDLTAYNGPVSGTLPSYEIISGGCLMTINPGDTINLACRNPGISLSGTQPITAIQFSFNVVSS